MKRLLSAHSSPGAFVRWREPAAQPWIRSPTRSQTKAKRVERTSEVHQPVGGHRFRARSVQIAVVLALLVWPLTIYWPAIHGRYGFRDDYSILREAHDEPGKVVRIATMQARPIDGWLLATSFRRVDSIDDLPGLRAISALLMGLVAAGVFLQLTASKWDRWTAAAAAALFAVLPAIQIVVGWAVGWPLPLSLLLALAAFAAARKAVAVRLRRTGPKNRDAPAFERRRIMRLSWWGVAAVFLAGSALVYQSNACFYFSLIGAAMWRRRRWRARRGLDWLARHIVTGAAGVLLAFAVALTIFATGASPVSQRIAFEPDWLGKLRWFAEGPLQNASALIVLNHDGGSLLVHRMAILVGVVVIAGCLRTWQTHGWRHGAWWPLGLAIALLGTFGANLVVADRWSVYRVLAPLSAAVIFALAMALLALGGRWLARIGLLALLLPGAWLARRQTVELIAKPQSVELNAVEAGAERIHPEKSTRVFVVTPRPGEHLAPDAFADEFGSLSTDSSWVTKEMLKLVMRKRYPDVGDIDRRYTYAAGHGLPPNAKYDVVIDLRRTLRNAAATVDRPPR